MATQVEIIYDYHSNYIIRDVYEAVHPQVINFMLEKYFIPHRLFGRMQFQKERRAAFTNKQYEKYVRHILRGESSIMAIDQKTHEIHAVALTKSMTEDWRSWTALSLCADQTAFTDIIELHNEMIVECAVEFPEQPFDTFHLFEYYMDETLKNDYIFTGKLFDAVVKTAKILNMPRVTTVALSQYEQSLCNDNSFDVMAHVLYSTYTKEDRKPFAVLRELGENEAILYQLDISALTPFYDMKVRGIDDIPKARKSAAHPAPLTTSQSSMSLFRYGSL